VLRWETGEATRPNKNHVNTFRSETGWKFHRGKKTVSPPWGGKEVAARQEGRDEGGQWD